MKWGWVFAPGGRRDWGRGNKKSYSSLEVVRLGICPSRRRDWGWGNKQVSIV